MPVSQSSVCPVWQNITLALDCYGGILKGRYCFCCRTLLALNNIELDLLALRKGSKSFASNDAVVDEDVLPLSAFDEAKAFSLNNS